jgi:2-keto-3-deoxy-L-rhamnonate aldolase RhmA
MRRPARLLALAALALPAAAHAQTPALTLWKGGQAAYGIFVPSEAPRGQPARHTEAGARALGASTQLDYLFLNLEGAYDAEAVRATVAGLAGGARRPTLLVRIPTIEAAGADSTRARVKQVLALGADGVVIPHVRGAQEARLAVSFFADAGARVWSPATPAGTVVAMLMIEDRGAVGELEAIAAVPGYSLLSCGIGSLTRDMGGDAPGAESACQRVRDAGEARGMPSMMTVNPATIGDRIARGYRGLLFAGTVESAESVIREVRGR